MTLNALRMALHHPAGSPPMTDYCQFIARAIAGLDKSTGESRRALYGRTRIALVEALRKVDSQLTESEITRERLLLEDAIRKVEADAAHRSLVEAQRPPPVAKTKAAERVARDEKPAALDGDRSTASGWEPAPGMPLPNWESRPEAKPDETSVADNGAHSPVRVRDRSQELERLPPMANTARQPFAEADAAEFSSEAKRDETRDDEEGAHLTVHSRDGSQELEPVPPSTNTASEPIAGAAASVADLDRFRLSLKKAFRNAEADAAEFSPDAKRDETSDDEGGAHLTVHSRDESQEPQPVPPSANTAREPLARTAASDADLDRFRLSLEKAFRNAEANEAESKLEANRDEKRAGEVRGQLPTRVDVTRARPEARSDETSETVPPRASQSRQPFARVLASVPDLDRFEPHIGPHEPKRTKREGIPRMSESSDPRMAPHPSPPQPLEAPGRAAKAAAAERPRRSKRALISAFVIVFMVVALALTVYWLPTPLKAVFVRNPAAQMQHQAALSRPKISDRFRAGQPGSAAGPTRGTAPAAVAQRVVLYEEDPTDPKGKRHTGSVIWRTETVSPGPEQAPELAVKAELKVPERHINMTMSIRRNTDKALPASHMIEIIFNLPADFPSGGISNLPSIRMKQAENESGAPLAGVTVKVTSEYFLTGLSASDADMQRNIALLKNRSWFVIWIVYNNGQHAMLTIEKGPHGELAFKEAFDAWAG